MCCYMVDYNVGTSNSKIDLTVESDWDLKVSSDKKSSIPKFQNCSMRDAKVIRIQVKTLIHFPTNGSDRPSLLLFKIAPRMLSLLGTFKTSGNHMHHINILRIEQGEIQFQKYT